MNQGDAIREWYNNLGLNQTTLAGLTRVDRSKLSSGINHETEPLFESKVFKKHLLPMIEWSHEDYLKRVNEFNKDAPTKKMVTIFADDDLYNKARKDLLNIYKLWINSPKDVDSERGIDSEQHTVHCSSITLWAKLLRWRDRESVKPFEKSKKVGIEGIRFEIDVYDEAVMNSHYEIEQPFETTLDMRMLSSGVVSINEIKPNQTKVDMTSYKNFSGGTTDIFVPIDRNCNDIFLSRTIFNGFQRDNGDHENVMFMLPRNVTTDRVNITIDLESVVGYSPLRRKPYARYTLPTSQDGEDIRLDKSKYAAVWSASYDNPDSDGRITLYWSLD